MNWLFFQSVCVFSGFRQTWKRKIPCEFPWVLSFLRYFSMINIRILALSQIVENHRRAKWECNKIKYYWNISKKQSLSFNTKDRLEKTKFPSFPENSKNWPLFQVFQGLSVWTLFLGEEIFELLTNLTYG